jgi:hypothetical protein
MKLGVPDIPMFMNSILAMKRMQPEKLEQSGKSNPRILIKDGMDVNIPEIPL